MPKSYGSGSKTPANKQQMAAKKPAVKETGTKVGKMPNFQFPSNPKGK